MDDTIYSRIEQLIAERGMTKKAFREQLRISSGNFGDWKRGKTVPGTNKLIDIAKAYNVSLDWLMLGRVTNSEVLKERNGAYFFDTSGQSNCQEIRLADEENGFIREYIKFTEYRKGQKECSDDSPE